MTGTPNLNVTELTTNQTGKTITINDGFVKLDGATQGGQALVFTSDLRTLTPTEFTSSFEFVVPGTLGATGTLTVPLSQRIFAVNNLANATYGCVVKGTTGATVTVPAAAMVEIRNNGTGCYAFTAAAAVGAPPTGAAGGGLTGTYPNPTVATNANLTGDVTSVGNAATVVKINGTPLAAMTATAGNLIVMNGSSAASVAMSGDATINSGGTITVTKIGGVTPATAAGVGAALNSGTVSINNSTTLTGTAAGTITIAPTTGTSDVIVNLPSGGGTVTVAAAPSFARQRVEIDFKQGATASVVTLNSGFVFGTSGGPTSYTAGAVASSIDRIMCISPDGTKWAVMAINQGFTV